MTKFRRLAVGGVLLAIFSGISYLLFDSPEDVVGNVVPGTAQASKVGPDSPTAKRSQVASNPMRVRTTHDENDNAHSTDLLRIVDDKTGLGVPNATLLVWLKKKPTQRREEQTSLTADGAGDVKLKVPARRISYLTVHAKGYLTKSHPFAADLKAIRLKRATPLHVLFINMPPRFLNGSDLSLRLYYRTLALAPDDPLRWSAKWYRQSEFARPTASTGATCVLANVLDMEGQVEVYYKNTHLIAKETTLVNQRELIIDFRSVLIQLRGGFDASLSLHLRLPPRLKQFQFDLGDEAGVNRRTRTVRVAENQSAVDLSFLNLRPARYVASVSYRSPANKHLVTTYLDAISIAGNTKVEREVAAGSTLELSLKVYEDAINPVITIVDSEGRHVLILQMLSFHGRRVIVDTLVPGVYRLHAADHQKHLRSHSITVTVQYVGQLLAPRHFEMKRECKLSLVRTQPELPAGTVEIFRDDPDSKMLERRLQIAENMREVKVAVPVGSYRLVASYGKRGRVEKTMVLKGKEHRLVID